MQAVAEARHVEARRCAAAEIGRLPPSITHLHGEKLDTTNHSRKVQKQRRLDYRERADAAIAHAHESAVADFRALAGVPAKQAVPRISGDVIGAINQAALDSRDRRDILRAVA